MSTLVGQSILENLKFIKEVSKTKSEKKRKSLLAKATTNELLAIVESALNIVKSRFRLTTKQRHRILPHVEYIRHLSRVKSENSARKLVQTGNGLGIAALLTPIIIEAFRYLSERKNGN
jgi:hypothetical protein